MSKRNLKAVALKYSSLDGVPFVSASGKGEVAKKILELAEENSIPIVENEALANVLSVSEIGSAIPENTWEVVADIFAWILKNDNNL